MGISETSAQKAMPYALLRFDQYGQLEGTRTSMPKSLEERLEEVYKHTYGVTIYNHHGIKNDRSIYASYRKTPEVHEWLQWVEASEGGWTLHNMSSDKEGTTFLFKS